MENAPLQIEISHGYFLDVRELKFPFEFTRNNERENREQDLDSG